MVFQIWSSLFTTTKTLTEWVLLCGHWGLSSIQPFTFSSARKQEKQRRNLHRLSSTSQHSCFGDNTPVVVRPSVSGMMSQVRVTSFLNPPIAVDLILRPRWGAMKLVYDYSMKKKWGWSNLFVIIPCKNCYPQLTNSPPTSSSSVLFS